MAKQKQTKTIQPIEPTERLPINVFTEKAYLNYSMYVILDRALPHIADGLKPVQRRIVYAMSELGLKSTAKFKKSARTVGDVLGKYHPHGDVACYEAMALMAQPFSYRYTLVDGQGNWGSIDDPKSFAAMRYTEARLSKYAEVLLSEVEQGTVEWVPNFDGSLQEPKLLPARLPNVLLNGTMGIAVGMSTDIPPHNLREVASACVRLLDEPEATLKQICEHIKGPDYPTSAEIITPRKEIMEMYKKGNGSIRMRAVYNEEEGDVIITALPYQTSGAKILEQIAAQMQAKKLPMVADLRDESDHENPVRLVIVPRSNRIDIEELMTHLFASTDLERTYRVNLNMIGTNGRPQVKGLLTILQEWLEHRQSVVRDRLQFRLDKLLARLHILDGLLIAYLNIDEVIRIIRQEDEPKTVLMKKFKLTDTQAEAILELKLRHLAKLEEFNIRDEQKKLTKEKDHIEKILASPKRLKALIRDEIIQDAEKYGDARISPIVERAEAKAFSEEQLTPTEPVTIVLSQMGWIRAAKGHEVDAANLNYRAGDSFRAKVEGRSNQLVVFMDSTGRTYSIPAHKLPSARGQGEPLTSQLTPPSGATFVGVMIGDPNDQYLVASDAGYGFVCKLEDLYTKNKSGKAVLKCSQGSLALTPYRITHIEDQFLAAVTNTGHMLVFPVAELPILPRGKGNKILQIPAARVKSREEYMFDIKVLNENNSLIVSAGKKALTFKPSDLSHYHGERGRRGLKLPRGLQQVEKLILK